MKAAAMPTFKVYLFQHATSPAEGAGGVCAAREGSVPHRLSASGPFRLAVWRGGSIRMILNY